jgi:trimeric autotransporter adhesin
MSSRLHNKFHRHNHHTTSTNDPRYPDATYDPIASYAVPFNGPFVATAPPRAGTVPLSGTTDSNLAIDAYGDINASGNITVGPGGAFYGNGTGLYGVVYTIVANISGSPYTYGSSSPVTSIVPSATGIGNTSTGVYSTVAGGSANNVGGTFSFIAAGQNNTSNVNNTFILGSNITAPIANYTYVNNISSIGSVNAGGNATVGGTLNVTGNSTFNTVNATGNATFNNASVTGTLSLNSFVTPTLSTNAATINGILSANSVIGRGTWLNSTYSGISGDGVIVDYLQGSPGLGRISVGNGTGTDSLAFYSNGPAYTPTTPTLYLSANGNVGIGTSSPSYPLHVVGNAYINGGLTTTSSINTNYLQAAGSNTTNSRAQGAYLEWNRDNNGDGNTWFINQQGTGNGGWVFAQADASNAITNTAAYINGNNGYVGIGTTTPNSRLTVVGDVSATGNLFGGTSINIQSGTSYTILPSDNGTTIGFTNAASVIAIPSTGITYPQGFQVGVLQLSTGRISLSSITSPIINNAYGFYKTTRQYSAATLIYTGSNGWVCFGDLST